MHLKMRPDSLDDYIAKFKHLCEEVEWGHNNAGTITLFKNRLTPGVTIPRVDCSYVFFFLFMLTNPSPRRLPSPCMTPVDDM